MSGLSHMESLSRSMSDLNIAQKRSFVNAFLQEEQSGDRASKKSTRQELVRAKNRKDSVYQNMLKTKERVKAMLDFPAVTAKLNNSPSRCKRPLLPHKPEVEIFWREIQKLVMGLF